MTLRTPLLHTGPTSDHAHPLISPRRCSLRSRWPSPPDSAPTYSIEEALTGLLCIAALIPPGQRDVLAKHLGDEIGQLAGESRIRLFLSWPATFYRATRSAWRSAVFYGLLASMTLYFWNVGVIRTSAKPAPMSISVSSRPENR